MRDAGQQNRPLPFEPVEAVDHPIEASVHHSNLGRSQIRQIARSASGAELGRGPGQFRQGSIDQAGDGRRDQQRDDCRQRRPGDPLAADVAGQQVAVDEGPVRIVVDRETDPHAGHAVHFGGEPRRRPELGPHVARDQTHQRIVGQRHELIARLQRDDPDPLVIGQVVQQVTAAPWIREHERAARRIDDGNDLLSDLAGARLALEHLHRRPPGRHGGRKQEQDQQERPPEQRRRTKPQAVPSGMNTYPRPHTV